LAIILVTFAHGEDVIQPHIHFPLTLFQGIPHCRTLFVVVVVVVVVIVLICEREIAVIKKVREILEGGEGG
jgi:cadmium resistance protein CadD (predicted permease)